ncbi:hypothetical protein [Bradyrhizobium sp. RD5-C2]|uniref:hypothetical protein n=1 Tax=Bradyrhizobium sp. RD5-C2 TaxID=244562 RepID=UPI001CC72D98|nr:hypothetical protein [Bradyrhizobium sp. RD5-C2]
MVHDPSRRFIHPEVPALDAMTGVPRVIASIMTKPEGSGQVIGNSIAGVLHVLAIEPGLKKTVSARGSLAA